MDPTYFVGIHSLFDPNPAVSCKNRNSQFDGKYLRAPSLQCTACTNLHMLQHYCTVSLKTPYTMASGSASSGSSSNTTQMDQAEDGVPNMMAAAAHQAVMPLLDRPLPIRKRQRKPNRKTMQTEADSPAVTTIRKQGRKPKAAGETHLVLFLLLLHGRCLRLYPVDCSEPAVAL